MLCAYQWAHLHRTRTSVWSSTYTTYIPVFVRTHKHINFKHSHTWATASRMKSMVLSTSLNWNTGWACSLLNIWLNFSWSPFKWGPVLYVGSQGKCRILYLYTISFIVHAVCLWMGTGWSQWFAHTCIYMQSSSLHNYVQWNLWITDTLGGKAPEFSHIRIGGYLKFSGSQSTCTCSITNVKDRYAVADF